MAREARSILRPLTLWPSAIQHGPMLAGVAVLDVHAWMAAREMPHLGAALARLVQLARERLDGLRRQQSALCEKWTDGAVLDVEDLRALVDLQGQPDVAAREQRFEMPERRLARLIADGQHSVGQAAA